MKKRIEEQVLRAGLVKERSKIEEETRRRQATWRSASGEEAPVAKADEAKPQAPPSSGSADKERDGSPPSSVTGRRGQAKDTK